MKALELVAESEFEYKEVDKPQIKDNEVLIRVKACGICGSDVHGCEVLERPSLALNAAECPRHLPVSYTHLTLPTNREV